MQTVLSMEALIRIGNGATNSIAVMSWVCPINNPSSLLISKSKIAISPLMHPVATSPRWKSKADMVISLSWTLLTLLNNFEFSGSSSSNTINSLAVLATIIINSSSQSKCKSINSIFFLLNFFKSTVGS